ncbi:hypothetical protein ACPPVS_08405 [Cellulomonas sp. McL0617]|uniref:hypothetical protein n=1 Tax=Cellulomonas sp. McL0617 TaxID=3415675 RepID=UPI003CEEBE59
MADPAPVMRRSGTRAFIYALLSLQLVVFLWVAVQGMQAVGVDPGLSGIAVDVGVASSLIAGCVAAIQRLADGRTERVRVRWIVAWAWGVPLAVSGLAIVLLLR